MYHADGALVVGVLQIRVEQAQLLDEEHTFIYNGAAGQAADIGVGAGLLEHAARDIETAVKGDTGLDALRLAHKALPDARHAGDRLVTEHFGAGGDFAPAQKRQTLFFADDLKQLFGLIALQLILREKEHTNAIFPLLANFQPQLGCGLLKEFVADLGQNADAVAGFALGVLAGAVLQMLDDLQCVVDGLVGLAPLDVDNRADATVVMLELGAVQPGRGLTLGKVIHAS